MSKHCDNAFDYEEEVSSEERIRADERERCIQIATKAQIKHQSINGVFSDSGSSIIRAIKAE